MSADASNYDLRNVECQSLIPSCKISSRSPRFAKGAIKPQWRFKASILSSATSASMWFDWRLRHNAFREPGLRTFPPRSYSIAGLPDWPFCSQISEIWPYFKFVGRTIFGLAIWLFWPFCDGRLANIFFRWPFLKICLYFKSKLCKLSTTTPLLKPRPLCVRFALRSELKRGSVRVRLCLLRCAGLALCSPSRCACVYTCLWVLCGLWSCGRP